MAYIIRDNDGGVILTLADQQVDSVTTTLDLVGQNLDNYGEYLNTNLVRLMTNFASVGTNSPRSPQEGQLWYNKTSKKLTVYNGTEFVSAYGVHLAGTQPVTTSTGDLWYDTINSQLKIWNGSKYNTIAPTVSGIYGKTDIDIPPTPILSEGTNIPQRVSILYSYGAPAAFITSASFFMNTASSVTYLGASSATNVISGITIFNDLEVKGNILTSIVKENVYSSATLPVGQLGMRTMVNDATTSTFNQIYVGGGNNVVPVFHNGSGWRIG